MGFSSGFSASEKVTLGIPKFFQLRLKQNFLAYLATLLRKIRTQPAKNPRSAGGFWLGFRQANFHYVAHMLIILSFQPPQWKNFWMPRFGWLDQDLRNV